MESKLSLSLQNALQFRRKEDDAETDYLTGLPNARHLFIQLEAELTRCEENGTTLAVLVCDLNDFKDVNERRGRLAGDRLIGMIAEGFRDICSEGETVARMGGDEFVFLLPGATPESALDRLESISSTVSAASRRGGHSVRVTASVGAAFCPTEGTIAEDLLALADRRMYLDKQRHYREKAASSTEGKAETSVQFAK